MTAAKPDSFAWFSRDKTSVRPSVPAAAEDHKFGIEVLGKARAGRPLENQLAAGFFLQEPGDLYPADIVV